MAFYQARQVGFDNRLGWNDAITHYLEDIRLNRVAGNFQGWLNALWGLWDMGKTFLYSNNDTVKTVDVLLDTTQKLIWRLEALSGMNDKNMMLARKNVTFNIQKNLSIAQVTAFKLMGDKGMFLPLRVPVEEFSEKDAIEGAGMGYVKLEEADDAETDVQDSGV
jgi:hypothetical protein